MLNTIVDISMAAIMLGGGLIVLSFGVFVAVMFGKAAYDTIKGTF